MESNKIFPHFKYSARHVYNIHKLMAVTNLQTCPVLSGTNHISSPHACI